MQENQGTKKRITADFSSETMWARRQWATSLHYWKKTQNVWTRILYPQKISSKNKVDIKAFLEIEKLKEFITTTPTLQEKLWKIIPDGAMDVHKGELQK